MHSLKKKTKDAIQSHNQHMKVGHARIERKRNRTVAGRRRGRGLGLRVGGEREGDERHQPRREPRRARHFLLQRTNAGAATVGGGGASPAGVRLKPSRGGGGARHLYARPLRGASGEETGGLQNGTSPRDASGPRVRHLRRGSSHTCLALRRML